MIKEDDIESVIQEFPGLFLGYTVRMAAVTFDTLKFVKTLQAAGLDAPQAEAIASAVRDSHDAADIATKADLRELELRMTIKLGTMMVASIGIVAALVKLL